MNSPAHLPWTTLFNKIEPIFSCSSCCLPRLCASQGQILYKKALEPMEPFTVTGNPCRAVFWSVMTVLNRTAGLLPLWPESPQTRPSGWPRRLFAQTSYWRRLFYPGMTNLYNVGKLLNKIWLYNNITTGFITI